MYTQLVYIILSGQKKRHQYCIPSCNMQHCIWIIHCSEISVLLLYNNLGWFPLYHYSDFSSLSF